MVEAAAEANDELMDKFFGDGELIEEQIRAGLRQRTLAGDIVVTMCGSAFKNKGVQAMLDAVIDYMPSPSDVPAIKGILTMIPKVSASEDDDAVCGAGIQDCDGPVRRQPDVLPGLFGRPEFR